MTSAVVLAIDQLTAGYGPIAAIRGVTLEVREAEVVTLLGANGAGKTTTIRAITGLVRPRSGTVRLDGQDITGRASADVAARGVAVVPEGRQVFADLTVDENLRIGAYRVRDRRVIAGRRDEMLALFPVLKDRLRQRAGTLSGGEQQMLAVGRALMRGPRLLLLDEPSMGLAPLVVAHLYETLAQVAAGGVTALLVEQNVAVALRLASRGYVLANGTIVEAGTAAELAASPTVADAYLGHRT
ncbi:MAG: ABC transporter ATP-binding protein [Candidatus Rokubacteria bacterium]|nr:ABC transporter ATP-binding protein [Candidatus Rokubacteria bacterium]